MADSAEPFARRDSKPPRHAPTGPEDGRGPAAPELERRVRLLERAVGRARNGVIITDVGRPDHPIVDANRSFLGLTGYREDEVIGRNCRFLQGPGTDPADRKRLRRAVARGEGAHVEVKNHRKDGSPFWNDLLISPIHDDRGRLTHFIGNQIDDSRRKAAEEAVRAEWDRRERRAAERSSLENAALTEAVLTSLDAHIAVLDRAGTIVAVNETWTDFARAGEALDAGAFVGVNYLDVLRHAEGPDAVEAPAALRGVEAVLAGSRRGSASRTPATFPTPGSGSCSR